MENNEYEESTTPPGRRVPPQNAGSMMTLYQVAQRLQVTTEYLKACIRKGWIEAVPVKWYRPAKTGMLTPSDYRIRRAEFRRLDENGIAPRPIAEVQRALDEVKKMQAIAEQEFLIREKQIANRVRSGGRKNKGGEK